MHFSCSEPWRPDRWCKPQYFIVERHGGHMHVLQDLSRAVGLHPIANSFTFCVSGLTKWRMWKRGVTLGHCWWFSCHTDRGNIQTSTFVDGWTQTTDTFCRSPESSRCWLFPSCNPVFSFTCRSQRVNDPKSWQIGRAHV